MLSVVQGVKVLSVVQGVKVELYVVQGVKVLSGAEQELATFHHRGQLARDNHTSILTQIADRQRARYSF